MIDAQLNIFDTIVLGILALSALVAFFRGFVKEVLSLGAWVGSAVITVYSFPKVASWLEPQVQSQTLAAGIAIIGTYLTCLILISIFNSLIIRYVKAGNEVGVLDNLLGLLFGAIRGAFIVSLGFLLIVLVTGEEYPIWIQEAKTRPGVEIGARILANAAPQYLSEVPALKKNLEHVQQAGEENINQIKGEVSDSVGQTGDSLEKGYKYMNVKDLDRLIQSNQPPSR